MNEIIEALLRGVAEVLLHLLFEVLFRLPGSFILRCLGFEVHFASEGGMGCLVFVCSGLFWLLVALVITAVVLLM